MTEISAEFLYCAFGEDYVLQAIASAFSLKTHNPDVRAVLVTNVKEKVQACPDTFSVFDSISFIDSEKQDNRYIKTSLYFYGDTRITYGCIMDCDTLILGSVKKIIKHLQYFDLALRPLKKNLEYSVVNRMYFSDIGEIFDGLSGNDMLFYNGGVVWYRRSAAVDRFFKRWNDNYIDLRANKGIYGDQLALMASIYEVTDVRVVPVSSEWNGNFGYVWEDDGMPIKRVVLHYKNPGHMRITGLLSAVSESWERELVRRGFSHLSLTTFDNKLINPYRKLRGMCANLGKRKPDISLLVQEIDLLTAKWKQIDC